MVIQKIRISTNEIDMKNYSLLWVTVYSTVLEQLPGFTNLYKFYVLSFTNINLVSIVVSIPPVMQEIGVQFPDG